MNELRSDSESERTETGMERYEDFGMTVVGHVTSVPFALPHRDGINLSAIRLRLQETNEGGPYLLDTIMPLETLGPLLSAITTLASSHLRNSFLNEIRYETLLLPKNAASQHFREAAAAMVELAEFIEERFEEDDVPHVDEMSQVADEQ